MFIRCNNSDIYWCLLHEGFAICAPEDHVYGVTSGLKPFYEDALDKYREKFEFEIIETEFPIDIIEFRTWKDFNPKWMAGMLAQNKYLEYFKD